jgi:hypothetical protein
LTADLDEAAGDLELPVALVEDLLDLHGADLLVAPVAGLDAVQEDLQLGEPAGDGGDVGHHHVGLLGPELADGHEDRVQLGLHLLAVPQGAGRCQRRRLRGGGVGDRSGDASTTKPPLTEVMPRLSAVPGR